MTLPDPRRTAISKVAHQGDRLRIVNDNRVVAFQVEAQGVLSNYLLVNGFFGGGQFDLRALQGVMDLLGAGEESRGSLNHMPACLDAHRVHQPICAARRRRALFRMRSTDWVPIKGA